MPAAVLLRRRRDAAERDGQLRGDDREGVGNAPRGDAPTRLDEGSQATPDERLTARPIRAA